MKMKNLVPWLYLLIITHYVTIVKTTDDPISMALSAEGYKHEIHNVTTEDKYILKLHRILPVKRFLRPVLLVHGMASSGFQYVLTGPGIPKALSFKLADNGYDVWLINCRCADFTQHKDIPRTSPEYWNFSFHEIAKYDLPAVIDHVLAETNQTFAHYVGHSQGTTAVMAMLSMFPRYNKKLKTLHLLAPSVYFGNAAIPLRTLVSFSDSIERAFTAAGLHRTPGVSTEIALIGAHLCSTFKDICKLIYFASLGWSNDFNEAFITVNSTITNIFRYGPNPISKKQLLHYSQLVKSGGLFQQYDHKKEKNLLIYNQSTPLQYQLSNVKTKIHFIYGTTDLVTNSRDVERLLKELRPWVIGVDKIIGYNHIDFIAAESIDKLVNTKILNLINKYGH